MLFNSRNWFKFALSIFLNRMLLKLSLKNYRAAKLYSERTIFLKIFKNLRYRFENNFVGDCQNNYVGRSSITSIAKKVLILSKPV